MSDDFVYAMVHKNRSNGEVTDISVKTVFGTEEQVAIAIKNSPVSKNVNTTFVECYNATSRQMNSRNQRKNYTFPKAFGTFKADAGTDKKIGTDIFAMAKYDLTGELAIEFGIV